MNVENAIQLLEDQSGRRGSLILSDKTANEIADLMRSLQVEKQYAPSLEDFEIFKIAAVGAGIRTPETMEWSPNDWLRIRRGVALGMDALYRHIKGGYQLAMLETEGVIKILRRD